MKKLNKKATKIFTKIMDLLGDKDYLKIDNAKDVFMALSVEKLYKIGEYQVVSFAHYFKQNGDLVQDPEMLFMIADQLVYPISIQHAFLGQEMTITTDEEGKFKGYYPKAQKDITTFAGQWMVNIKSQQNL